MHVFSQLVFFRERHLTLESQEIIKRQSHLNLLNFDSMHVTIIYHLKCHESGIICYNRFVASLFICYFAPSSFFTVVVGCILDYGTWMTFLPSPIRWQMNICDHNFLKLTNVSFVFGLLYYGNLTYPEHDRRGDMKRRFYCYFNVFM